jgi:hypothetical protein
MAAGTAVIQPGRTAVVSVTVTTLLTVGAEFVVASGGLGAPVMVPERSTGLFVDVPVVVEEFPLAGRVSDGRILSTVLLTSTAKGFIPRAV